MWAENRYRCGNKHIIAVQTTVTSGGTEKCQVIWRAGRPEMTQSMVIYVSEVLEFKRKSNTMTNFSLYIPCRLHSSSFKVQRRYPPQSYLPSWSAAKVLQSYTSTSSPAVLDYSLFFSSHILCVQFCGATEAWDSSHLQCGEAVVS